MAFGIETTSQSNSPGGGATSLSFSHTLTAAVLLVGQVGTGASVLGDRTVSGITYNAVAMAIKGAGDNSNFVRATIAALDVTGVTGAHNFVITMGGTSLIGGGVTGFTEANVASFGTVATASANDSSPTVTAASATGETVVAVVASDANATITEGGTGTQLWKTNAIGADCCFGGEWYAGAASVVASYTASSPDTGWAMVAMSIKPASAGAVLVSQPSYRQSVPMRPGPGGFDGAAFQFATTQSTIGLALPGVGVLTLTGLAPTVSATNNVQALPGVGALTLTGLSPTAAASGNQAALPGVGLLTLTGIAPTASASNNQSVAPGVGVLTLTGLAPSASATLNAADTPRAYQMNIPMRPTGGGLVIGTPFRFATQAQAGVGSATPGVGTLVLTGLSPTVTTSGNQSVLPGVGVLTLTGLAPTASASGNQNALPGVGVLALTGLAPTATASNNQTALPGIGVLTLTGLAPTVVASGNQFVLPGVATLTLAGFAPSVLAGAGGTPGTGVLTLAGLAPTVTVTGNKVAAPGTGVLTLTGLAPAAFASNPSTAHPGVGVLLLAGFAPDVRGNAKLGPPPHCVVARIGNTTVLPREP